MGVEISVSIVTYEPDLALLGEVVSRLYEALRFALERGSIRRASLCVVDNSTDDRITEWVKSLVAQTDSPDPVESEVLASLENLGYGLGHNLAIEQTQMDYHLVLNPDVLLAEDALDTAVRFMEDRTEVGILSPHAEDASGARAYLCKRYPSVLDLVLRGFAPAFLKRRLHRRLDHYEMRDLDDRQVEFDIPLASGCFMFCRCDVLRAVGGFSKEYFMYFEDFDLCMRVKRLANIAYVPTVRIVHYGGYVGRKGLKHILMFLRSGRVFFSAFGWRWW